MDSIAIFFEEEEKSASAQNSSQVRQHLRNSLNVLKLADTEFIHNYRLPKEAFQYVLSEVKIKLKIRSRTSAVSAELKLAATLQFLAEGSYQRGVGNDFNLGLAQSTMSGVFEEVLDCLQTEICPKWIKMAIILTPNKDQQHLYYNRKGFYSVNAMIVCDHKMRIRFIDARYPGSSHDALIWSTSELRHFMQTNFESGDRSTRLLGDAGYPLEPFLITPFRAAIENSPESKYNSAHSKTRNIVERTIGVLKNRFRCLLSARQLHYTPAKVTKIVNVCAALHNICLHFNAPDINYVQLLEYQPPSSSNIEDSIDANSNALAVRIREEIKDAINLSH